MVEDVGGAPITGGVKFANDEGFHLEVRRRVDEYFRTTGRRPRDCWQLYLKTAILVGSFALVYALLVFVADTWWQGLLLAVLLGLSAAGIGFNVQHDGGHQAYSRWPVRQRSGIRECVISRFNCSAALQ